MANKNYETVVISDNNNSDWTTAASLSNTIILVNSPLLKEEALSIGFEIETATDNFIVLKRKKL